MGSSISSMNMFGSIHRKVGYELWFINKHEKLGNRVFHTKSQRTQSLAAIFAPFTFFAVEDSIFYTSILPPTVDINFSSAQANLPHHSHQVIEEPLLDDLSILPVGDSTKFEPEFFVRGRDRFAVRPFHWPLHGACKIGYCARIVALTKKILYGLFTRWLSGNVLKNSTHSS